MYITLLKTDIYIFTINIYKTLFKPDIHIFTINIYNITQNLNKHFYNTYNTYNFYNTFLHNITQN